MSGDSLPRLVILLSGRGSNFHAIREAVERGRLRARIAAVIADRPEAAGLRLAEAAGIDAVTVDRGDFPDRAAFERQLEVAIAGFEPHYVVLAGFMRVLGADFVERLAGRLINIHPSLLPRHRGLETHQRALDAGDRQHGASVHFVTPALDAGPVISQAVIEVGEGDSADTLADRLLPIEHRLYPATLALLLGHRVELHHEEIQIDNAPLAAPLLLDRDLDDRGRLLAQRDGG